MVGESGEQVLALFVSQCAVITLKNCEKCMFMNNKWSQQWLVVRTEAGELFKMKLLFRSLSFFLIVLKEILRVISV